LVHPTVVTGSAFTVGEGSIVCPGSVLTSNVTVGRHTQVHICCAVGHDTTLADYVTILPGATIAGNVSVEAGVLFGSAASTNQGLTIAAGSTVGSGASVVKDIPPGVVAVGVPARPRAGDARV